jgi:Protein of unknown function (DUF2652)
MENKGLLFIPDISGFTKFINETELEHSSHIIQELLELLINANQMGLEISEIEGDAILFYKFGDAPGLEEVYQQVEKMFCRFHQYLDAYEQRRFCQCAACRSAIELTLKVITHYGEFTGYSVKNFKKLIGKDVIVAHQLLKNDIDQHEYWLVTNNLLKDGPPIEYKRWMSWSSSSKYTPEGEILFQFTQIGELKNEMAPLSPLQLEPSETTKMITVSEIYEADIIKVFYTTVSYKLRSHWLEGVKEIIEVSHLLPQVGSKFRCEMDNGQINMYTSSFSYHPDNIAFSETDEMKRHSMYFTFEKLPDNRTRFTIDFYLKKSPVKQLIFNIFRKSKKQYMLKRSLQNLEKLISETEMPF